LWDRPRVRQDVFDRVISQIDSIVNRIPPKLESGWSNTLVTK